MDNKATLPKRGSSRRYGASLTVGLIGLALSLTAFFAVGKWAAKWRASDFDRLAEARCELFDREVTGNVGKLTALKQFFDASQFVGRHGFADFIDPLHEISTHKLAFFWAPQVLEANRRSFEEAVRAEGFSDFNIHCDSPVDGTTAVTQRERYYPVRYYCHESNWAMGMDLLREPHLRKAIEQAVDTDQPVVTGSILFPGEQQDWSGVAVLHAVYHRGLSTTTVDERRSAIEGVVVCAMQLDDILENVIQTLTPAGVNIQAADLSTPGGKQILYQRWARLQSGDPEDTLGKMSDASGLIYATHFHVAGHTWELRCTPSTGYLAAHPLWTHWIVLLGGLLLTALLAIQFYMMRNRTGIVEAIVAERTTQLRASEERYRAVAEDMPILICRFLPDGEITYVNETYCKYFEKTSKELVGTQFFSLIPEADREGVMVSISALTVESPTKTHEHRVIAPDGQVRWQRWTNRALFDAQRKVIAYQSIGEDITERKQAEEALIESEARYRTIFNGSAQGILVADIETKRFKYANPAMCRMLGYTEEEMTQLAVMDIHPRESLEHVISEFEAQARGEVTLSPEIPCLRRDGKIIYADISTTKATIGGRECNVGFLTDITERMQAEEALRESEQQLKATNHDLGERVKELNCLYGLSRLVDSSESSLESILQGTCDLIKESWQYPDITCVRIVAGDSVYKTANFKTSKWKQSADIFVNDKIIGQIEVFHLENMPNLDEGPFLKEERSLIDSLAERLGKITEHMRAEEALRASEETHRGLIENLPQRIFHKDANSVYVSCNDNYADDLGIAAHEIRGKTDFDFHPKELAEKYRADDLRLMQSGQTEEIEESYIGGGQEFVVQTVKTALTDDAGNATGILGIFWDITERKRVEEALRESEERYHRITDAVTDYIYKVRVEDGQPAETIHGQACEAVTGYSTEEFRIDPYLWIQMIPQEDRDPVRDQVSRILSGDDPEPIEHRLMRKDGCVRWVTSVLVAHRDGQGNLFSYDGLIRDITERKLAEEALAESEKRFRNIAESMADWIWEVDSKGVYTYVSSNVESLLGYRAEEVLGKTPFDLMTPKEAERVGQLFQLISENKEPMRDLENWKLTKDGRSVCLLTNGTPLFDDQGNLLGYRGVDKDITETKRLQELESRAERLEMAGMIAGQVAHDFNNLLAPIIAYPEFIREELPRNHPALQYLDQIEKAALKIADINQDLLAMGRRGHYNMEVLNLNTVVQHAISELEPYPQTLACEINLSDDVMDILGGGAQLHRMISNLLHNAKDAMQDIGQITVKTENYYVDDVSVAYGRVPKGEYVKLTISDTGCGISDDIVQKILDPFFTTKTTDKQRGSGLGLSVVDAVVKDHNGYFDLKTQSGKGTSFYLYFPITRKSSDEDHSDEISGGSETILVVDDDDIQRDVSTQLLKKLGYEVNSVESGEKAIEFLRENPQDLLMLDMVMPGGIDGAETYQQVLEINPDQRAIIVSGFSESDRVEAAQKLGAGAFVKKPLTKKAIAVAVRTELDKREKVLV